VCLYESAVLVTCAPFCPQVVYLAVDGLTSTWQDNMFHVHKMSVCHQVCVCVSVCVQVCMCVNVGVGVGVGVGVCASEEQSALAGASGT
jgi:hypothetical protein